MLVDSVHDIRVFSRELDYLDFLAVAVFRDDDGREVDAELEVVAELLGFG